MKARLFAWVIVLGIGFIAYRFWDAWQNPWKGAPTITNVMPKVTPCGKDCT